MYAEILAKVISLIQEVIEDDECIVTEDSSLMDDLELSSLDIFSVLSDLEEEYDLEISDKLLRKMIYVKDVAKIIEQIKEGEL